MTDFWTGKKVFGTGLTGFIGTHLYHKLISLGAEVRIFKHLLGSELVNAPGVFGGLEDGRDEWGVELYIQRFQPEIVFHLAAQPIVGEAWNDPYMTLDTNIGGTYNLYNYLKPLTSVQKIIHISTDKVFGGVEFIEHNSPLLGTGHPYNASKLCGDVIGQMYLQAYDFPVIVVRHANIYGAGDKHWDRVIPGTIKHIVNGEPPVLRGWGRSVREYIHVSEIVEAYIKLAESNYTGTINLGGVRPYATSIVVNEIMSLMGSKITPVLEPNLPGELMTQMIDNHFACELIGWNPKIDLVEGLEITIPYYEGLLAR